MEQIVISIVGTKEVKQKDSDYKIYTKEQVLERVKELLDDNYGYSVVWGTK